jgi:hypothetical protein
MNYQLKLIPSLIAIEENMLKNANINSIDFGSNNQYNNIKPINTHGIYSEYHSREKINLVEKIFD